MKTAIVCVSPPSEHDTKPDQLTGWNSLKNQMQALAKTNPNIEEIAEGVWRIPVDTGLHALGMITWGAHQKEFRCRVMFLEDGAQWLEVPRKQY